MLYNVIELTGESRVRWDGPALEDAGQDGTLRPHSVAVGIVATATSRLSAGLPSVRMTTIAFDESSLLTCRRWRWHVGCD